MPAGLSKRTPEAPNFEADREFWLAVRRALLAIVAAIERRWEVDQSNRYR